MDLSDNELDASDVSDSNGSGPATDSDTDSEEEATPQPKKRRRIMWKKTNVFNPTVVPELVRQDLSHEHREWSPGDYFAQYVDEDDYQILADLTGRHYLQATGRNLETSPSEIKRFIGMSLMMGCISMKRLRMYWQRSTRIPVIADCMPRDRFFKLRNHFTVVDNNLFTDEAKAADRFWKVRPFMERIRRACLTLPREGNMSIDEQMISFTGRCPSRQYVPRKPRPTGLKNFVLAGASGLVLDFELYQGAGSFQQYQMDGKKAGQGTGAVLRLCESLSRGHRLFCDRFFTTLPLISHMLDKGIYLTGTIAKRNLPVTFTGDAAMAKSGSGTSEQYVLDGAAAVSMVKWYDNKGVLMASPLFGIEPEDECRRWSKKDKQHLEVKRPAVIERYNKYMGGVDLCDRMISYHKMGARTRRWHLRVISHFIDLALSNCWIEGRLDSREKMQLYDFRESVALVLINSVDESLSSSDSDTVQPPPRGRVSALPAIVSRVVAAKHLPVACDLPNSARCRKEGCKGKTRIKCERCNVFLCVSTARSCFKEFHTK